MAPSLTLISSKPYLRTLPASSAIADKRSARKRKGAGLLRPLVLLVVLGLAARARTVGDFHAAVLDFADTVGGGDAGVQFTEGLA